MFLEKFNQLIEDANNFIYQELEASAIERIICFPNASATEVYKNPEILHNLPRYNQHYAIIGIQKKEDGDIVLHIREIENYKNTKVYHLDFLSNFELINLANFIYENKNIFK